RRHVSARKPWISSVDGVEDSRARCRGHGHDSSAFDVPSRLDDRRVELRIESPALETLEREPVRLGNVLVEHAALLGKPMILSRIELGRAPRRVGDVDAEVAPSCRLSDDRAVDRSRELEPSFARRLDRENATGAEMLSDAIRESQPKLRILPQTR